MNGYGMHGWGLAMGLGWIIPLLLIGVLLYYINNNKQEALSAKEILDRRYAKGEIDEKAYKRMKALLEDKSGDAS